MKIGLVGNQNSGKTTLFNCLTGMNAKIGNWPGVTIEKKEGIIRGTNYTLIDLPGIYSLNPYSVEEEVSRKFILNEKPDIIINIIDATCIERSLYLTTQLLELDCKVIVALNMSDILEKKGFDININKMEELLGTRVIKISALNETGIDKLIKEIEFPQKLYKIKIFDDSIEEAIKRIENNLNYISNNKRFIAVNLLSDNDENKFFNVNNIELIKNKIEKQNQIKIDELLAMQRYKFIENLKKECINKKNMPESVTDKLDRIFLHKLLAFPIFVIIMLIVYYLSVGIVGSFTVDAIEKIIFNFENIVKRALNNFGVSDWLNSLIVDGIIAGVGSVLNFLPQLAILFLCISILETTGYMSRVALLFDKIFRKIGLSGKSIIPFIVGSGCSVPGIIGTRIIENDDERKMTSILTPFIPCSAKLPIITLFTSYFFPQNSGLISAMLYFLSILIIIISAILMKKFVFKATSSTYISELPEYKLPNFKYIVKDTTNKVLAFIKRAGTTIFLCSIIVWLLLSFSIRMEYGIKVEESILAYLGNKISWIFKPIVGVSSWEITVSSIQGLIAKEQVVSSMAVINGLMDSTNSMNILAKTGTFGFFTPASALAFTIFNLFSAPCFGAIAAMKKELGSIKNVLKAVCFQTGLAWLVSSVVYKIGNAIENGNGIINDLLVALIIVIMCAIIKNIIQELKNHCNKCPYSNNCNKY